MSASVSLIEDEPRTHVVAMNIEAGGTSIDTKNMLSRGCIAPRIISALSVEPGHTINMREEQRVVDLRTRRGRCAQEAPWVMRKEEGVAKVAR